MWALGILAADHHEPVLGQPDDGQVALEVTLFAHPLGVDDMPRFQIDLVAAQPAEQRVGVRFEPASERFDSGGVRPGCDRSAALFSPTRASNKLQRLDGKSCPMSTQRWGGIAAKSRSGLHKLPHFVPYSASCFDGFPVCG